jgi:F0F1-type ATP synthase membrane subunit b/b'
MAAVPVLLPDPVVMTIQAGLFLATVVVVKKNILDPYLKLKAKREELTVTSQAKSKDIEAQVLEMEKSLKQSLDSARTKARAEVDKIKTIVMSKAGEIQQKAQDQAEQILEKSLGTLKKDIEAFQGDQTKRVEISKELVAKVLN